ncbi:MAG: sensor histidine kinase [Burkholderiales bacterium]
MQKIGEELAALRTHLAARRSAILKAWRNAVYGDAELTTASSLPRTQFYDHIPDMLDGFARKLHLSEETNASKEEQKEDAAAHGLQRWQQGYHLREVTREWGRLQMCLVDELESYAFAHRHLEPAVMCIAWRALSELCSEGVRESTAQYFHLQELEAIGHVRDLEQALEQVRELEPQRAELWQQAAHDLRGNLGVVANATAGLSREGVPEPTRSNFLRLLQRNMASLHSMLDDVTSLARLQAGQEQLHVNPFDAASLLMELCENLQPLAVEHGLFLKTDGPATLQVEGDAVKTRRIAQNLLINALKYTRRGGVTVSWGDSRKNDADRWMLCVQDTGPGLHAGPGAPLAAALEEATEEARHVEDRGRNGTHRQRADEPDLSPTSAPDSLPVHQEQGEGIGLSIVKRLCELLDASVELESRPDEGTLCRVVLPRQYSSAEHKA